MVASPPTPPNTPIDLLAAFFDPSQPCECFDDPKIEQIALLLARLGHIAHKEPRTYIVLRCIGRLEVLEQLLKAGFGDGWFPVEARSLPGFLDPSTRGDIVNKQRLVLTKATNLENGRHCHFGPDETLPFTTLSRLGSGSFGQVTKIESTVTFRQYALKTIRRRAAFGEQSKRTMKDILSEMRIMQSLQHEHIVRYIGSYTNKNSFGILMSPIAEQDLAVYLQEATSTMHPTIRTFFGCLATALSFLHENAIRHRDIKPQNILIYGSKVLFTDFGLSRDYVDTTSGPTQASPRYRAPEVAAGEGRNTSADIWALGCVFLEMLATLRGYNVDWLRKYYLANGDGITTNFHANLFATQRLLNEWTVEPEAIDTPAIVWTKRMLEPRRNDRPSASEIANEITTANDRISFMYSCSSCCDSDTDSDSILSVLEDLRDTPTRESSKIGRSRKPLPQHVIDSAETPVLNNRPHSLDDKTTESLDATSNSDVFLVRKPINLASSDDIVLDRAAPDSKLFDGALLQIQPPTIESQSTKHSVTKSPDTEPARAREANTEAPGIKSSLTLVSGIQSSQAEPSGAKPKSTAISATEYQSTGPLDTASSVTEPSLVEGSYTGSSAARLSYVDAVSTELSSTRPPTRMSLSSESLPKSQTDSLQTNVAGTGSSLTKFLNSDPPNLEPLQFEFQSQPSESFLSSSIPFMPPRELSSHTHEDKGGQEDHRRPAWPAYRALPDNGTDSSSLAVEYAQIVPPNVPPNHHAKTEIDSSKEVMPSQARSFRGIENADYDISHIPFHIDDKLICVPGKVPVIFGRCIEFMLQAENHYFTDCLDFDKHKVTPYAIQHLLAAFDGSSTKGWHYDFSDCEAADVARFLQTYLNSLPTTLLPITLNTKLPLPDLKEIIRCLLSLKQDSPTNFTMGLCLIAFLATYVDLGKRQDPTQLWVSTVAEPYSLPKFISPAPALPTLCFLVANARQILKLTSGKTFPQPRWQPTTSRSASRLVFDSEGLQEDQNKLESREQVESVGDGKRKKLRKRESSLNIFRPFSGEGWRGWSKRSDG